MSKSTKTFRDIKTAAPRTQVYVRCLMRKHGATAQDLKDAVEKAGIERRAEGFTSHNSYSLQKLADSYGFRFFSEMYDDGRKHYFFASVKNDPKLAAKASASKASKASPKAPKAQGVPMLQAATENVSSSAPVAIAAKIVKQRKVASA